MRSFAECAGVPGMYAARRLVQNRLQVAPGLHFPEPLVAGSADGAVERRRGGQLSLAGVAASVPVPDGVHLIRGMRHSVGPA
jgi:hypothetical protein